MNNHHLFLIRSDYVTQLAADLLAGILVLVLFFSMSGAPKGHRLPDPIRPVSLGQVAMPAGTAMFSLHEPRLR